MREFETKSVRMERRLLITVRAPAADIDRILDEVTKFTPLPMGSRYDRNAFETAAGTERYRPLEGAAAGAEAEVRRRPGVVHVNFELPDDQELLKTIVEAVFQIHSYQEPVIRVQEILTARSKGLDDRQNPNRWWNTSGDWMEVKQVV